MRFAETNTLGKLWWEALSNRWSVRRAAGESRWQLILNTTRWVCLFPRQNRWLRALDARRTTQQAAKADPRLYERWHHPYISSHFDVDTRRRIVSSHYAFMMRHFPAQLCERIVRGYGVRLASLSLDGTSRAYLHLGKPTRAEAGELSLSLLTQDKEVLASCVLTFDRHDSLTIGAIHGPGPHTPFAASSAFIRGSHGLHPSDLLVSLVRAMATTLGVRRARAVSSSACIAASTPPMVDDGRDSFWRKHGALPADAGCHELPLSPVAASCSEGNRNLRERRERREAFCQQACETFIAAFCNNSAGHSADSTGQNRRKTAPLSRSLLHGSPAAGPEPGNLLAANL